MQARVLSNAIWNVVTGLSGAIVSIAVPPFLTRQLSHEAYGAWSLALQIGTYINLFGFGLQIAVGRYVAHSYAHQDKRALDGYVSTAFWFLIAAAIVGFLGICIVGLNVRTILPNLSSELVRQTQIAVVLLGFSFAISLPGTIFSAVFTGLQQSKIPAVIQSGGRVVLAIILILSAFAQNLAVLAAGYALMSTVIVLVLWITWKKRTESPTLRIKNARRSYGKELFGFCLSLSVWNISMLLVSGLDLVIVGHWDFKRTAYYAVGITLSTFISSVLTSLCNALIPATAASIASGSVDAALLMLRRSLRLISAISVLAAAPLIFTSYIILSLWVGPEYAAQSSSILAILAISGVIRTLLLPYVTVAIGTGEQRRMIITPVVEGVCSLVISLMLAEHYGALGVAIAKVIGACIGILLLVVQNALSHTMPSLTRRELLRDAITRPVIVWAILSACYFCIESLPIHDIAAAVMMAILTVICVWGILVPPEDKAIASRLWRNVGARVLGKSQ